MQQWLMELSQCFVAWQGWGTAGVTFAWVVTSILLVLGLVGSVIPVIPGHLIILAAAIIHGLMLGENSGLRWWSFLILIALLSISQILEIVSGAAGTKWFGGTKWGAWGAFVGGLVGMFFFPIGIILGPLIGCLLFEKCFAKQENKAALSSGIGSVVGTVTGMLIKIAFGIVMIVWFVLDALEVV